MHYNNQWSLSLGQSGKWPTEVTF